MDGKREADIGPANDDDLRYARILETITKSAFTTREEVVSSGKTITDQLTEKIDQSDKKLDQTDKKLTEQLDQTDKKLTEQIVQSDKQMDKLTYDVSKLQIAFDQGIKSCNERIQQQEENLDEFEAHFARKLEQLQKSPLMPDLAPQAASLEQPLLPAWVDPQANSTTPTTSTRPLCALARKASLNASKYGTLLPSYSQQPTSTRLKSSSCRRRRWPAAIGSNSPRLVRPLRRRPGSSSIPYALAKGPTRSGRSLRHLT